jgi:hypothetical protein
MAADRVIRRSTAGAVIGGLIYASSIVMPDLARQKAPVPALVHWLPGLGIAATLAANVAHVLGHGNRWPPTWTSPARPAGFPNSGRHATASLPSIAPRSILPQRPPLATPWAAVA